MPTRRFPRAAKRFATFAATLALGLFCALAFISYASAQQSRVTTTRTPPAASRVTPAVVAFDYMVTTTGSAIVLTDVSGNGDTLIVAEPAANQIKFVAAGRTFSVNGGAPLSGDSGNISLSGIGSVTVNQGGGNDTLSVQAFASLLPSLKVNGDAGNDQVNFSGSINFAANASLDANLQDDSATPGTDSAVVASGVQLIASGTGTIDVRVSKSVIVGGRLQTQNGDLTVEANRQVTATSGAFVGVGISGGTIQTTGTGNISVKGTGGAGDFTNNYGVLVDTAGQVLATGGGMISIDGAGGAGSGGATAGSSNLGVYITGSGSLIKSSGGAIQVTGQGGTTNDSNVLGVTLDELGTIETDGAGTLTINGTGGTVNGGGSPTFVNSGGVFITPGDVNGDGGIVKSTGTGANAGAIVINGTATDGGAGAAQGVRVDTPGTVTTVDGSISITGTGGPCGNACLGTSIRGPVTATGAGSINLTGTGAASTGAFATHGVNVRSGGNVATKDGDINVTGTGGNGTDNAGFNLAPTGGGILQTTGTGNVNVNANTIRIHPVNATINVGTHAVTLRQKTNGTAINLGSLVDSTASTVELSDAELDRVTAGTLNVGDANSGTFNVSANITRAAATNLNLASGADINIATGSLASAGGNVSLNGANTFPFNSGTDVNAGATGTVTLASAKNLLINITGTTVDTGYTQLNVTGLVNLNGANLVTIGSHMPSPGQTFVVVNNDGADAITGTFNGLPEGGTIPNFLGSSFSASISYTGGDGNDAVLTVNSPVTASFSISDVTLTEGNVGNKLFIFTVTKSGTGAASVSFETQDGTAEAGSDYSGLTGTAFFAANETTQQITVDVHGDTTPELDETFKVVLLNTTANATISDGTGIGTIKNDDESVSAGQLIISEFRLRGPGASVSARPGDGGPTRDGGPVRGDGGAAVNVGGIAPPEVDTSPEANDEFIELYNNTDHPLLVTTTDSSSGWAVVASGGVELFTIPNGTIIPARAHYLGANGVGYSLGAYAAGDAGWVGVEVPDNAGIALFRTHEPTNYGMGTRLNAVGSTAEADALYKEGAGYPALTPADIALNLEQTFFRDLCSYAGGGICATAGRPKDSGDNAADFLFADTEGTQTAAGKRLGAPGPENLSSHVQRNADFGFFLLDRTKSSSVAPNRVRDFTPNPGNNSPQGTLTIRRRVRNNTGAPIGRLRFRIIEFTTYPSTPGTADLRAISAEEADSVSNVGDAETCGAAPTPCVADVEVTTLESPPAQAQGGGFNSTLNAVTVTLGSPLADGQSINLKFVLGVVQGGTFRFYVNIEALGAEQLPPPQRPGLRPGRR